MIEGQSHFQPFGLPYWGSLDLNKGVGSNRTTDYTQKCFYVGAVPVVAGYARPYPFAHVPSGNSAIYGGISSVISGRRVAIPLIVTIKLVRHSSCGIEGQNWRKRSRSSCESRSSCHSTQIVTDRHAPALRPSARSNSDPGSGRSAALGIPVLSRCQDGERSCDFLIMVAQTFHIYHLRGIIRWRIGRDA